MSREDLIIVVYCVVEELYQEVVGSQKLRQKGPIPALSDSEVITILIVGEYLGLGSDKRIWAYFREHWSAWFPNLGHRTTFVRQSANLLSVQSKIQELLSKKLCEGTDLNLFDGFPIPICHIKRYKRSRPFKGEGAVGYCAAKDEKYFGFKGHLLISHQGVIRAISVTPANIDERDVLPEVLEGLTGDTLADKGLICLDLNESLANHGLHLHTPLRKNMKDPRPKSFVSQIMNIRRKVETVIGQLVDRIHIQTIRSKDTWHLMAKIGRKILSHTVCFFINLSRNPDAPLQLDLLLS